MIVTSCSDQVHRRRGRWVGMALTPVGSAAGFAPQRSTADDLLDAIRRALVPGDPVARLLADWPAAPVRAVATRAPAQRRPSD